MRNFLFSWLLFFSVNQNLWSMDFPSSKIHKDAPRLKEYRALNNEIIEACRRAFHFLTKNIQDRLAHDKMHAILKQLINGYGRNLNWSLAHYQEGFLIAVRTNVSYVDEEIVPGGRADKNFPQGKNFWWLNWSCPCFMEADLFFVSDKNFSNLLLLFPAEKNAQELSLFSNPDIQLLNCGDNIFAVHPDNNNFAFKIVDIEISTGFGKFSAEDPLPHVHEIKGKNYGMVSIDDDKYWYLDYFGCEGMVYRFVDCKKSNVVTKVLSYDKGHILDVNGSCKVDDKEAGINAGIMPAFSFGTPVLAHKGKYFGVGHIKIINFSQDTIYPTTSNIEQFRTELHNKLKQKYGRRYVEHNACFSAWEPECFRRFIYMMYVYYFTVDENRNIIEMKMSDAFLLYPSENKNYFQYTFSLVFPMGIAYQPETNGLFIAAGVGDYYCVLMTMDMNDAINLCHHDARRLDLSNYQYKEINADEYLHHGGRENYPRRVVNE